jgi:pilus assembly protein CpaC
MHRADIINLLAAAVTAAGAMSGLPAAAQEVLSGRGLPETATVGRSAAISVQAGQGRVVVLPGAASNVYVADPKIAEVRPASATSLFVFGTGVGNTTLAALDASGSLITQLTITVTPNAAASAAAGSAIQRSVGGISARTTPTPAGVGLTGNAATPDAANRAFGLTRQYLPPTQTVQNNLRVQAATQVSLQVSIAEVSRDVTRELGVRWQSLGGVAGRYAVGFANPLSLLSVANTPVLTSTIKGTSVQNIVAALAQDNLARMLAEPNLTALSGETASFLVGGEFPIPVAQDNNSVSVSFKQYGISLAFVPTVLAENRINLHVRTEVSALTTQGAVTLSNSNNAISIPAITVRRADTTLELGSGQSFAIAGLLQDSVSQQDVSVPWLGEIPVLGALFRSTSFLHNKSELVIMVTPTVVRPVDDRSRLHLPGETYLPPDDVQRNLLLRQQEQRPPAVSVNAADRLRGFILQ